MITDPGQELSICNLPKYFKYLPGIPGMSRERVTDITVFLYREEEFCGFLRFLEYWAPTTSSEC